MYSYNSETSSPGSLSPTGDSSSSLDLHSQLIESQKENARLKKEIEAKETKLNSSMRSIKMFWSPELKKERSARKTEAEKYARLKEQFNVVSDESQHRTEIIQDLQGQLKQLRQSDSHVKSVSPSSSLGLLSSQEDLHKEVEALRFERESQENEGYVLQKSLEELSTRLESQQQALIAKDETIARLMEMVQKKTQENKASKQQDIDRKQLENLYAEMDSLRAGIEERDRAIASLQDEIANVKIRNVSDELHQSANLLGKDSQIADLEAQITSLKATKLTLDEEDAKRQEERKQADVYQSHSQFLKAKVESLKTDTAKKEAALNAATTKLETFTAHLSDQQQHISVLQSSLQAKDQHIKNLQSELEVLRMRLDDREACLKEKERLMLNMTSEHSESSYAVENLKTMVDTKERQVVNLRNRCESLQTELQDKDNSVSSIRAQLSSLRGEHQDSATTMNNLEATIRDKDRYIEMLQTQRQRNSLELNEEVDNLKRNNEKLESKVASLREELSKKEESFSRQEEDYSSIHSSAQEKSARLEVMEQKIRRLERDLEESVHNKTKLASELSSKKLEVTRLEKEVNSAKREVENLKMTQESKAREDTEKLKSECIAKDRQIEDLERQIKELNKKMTNIKRSQQVERERQAQLLNEVKKQEGENDEKVDEIKKELKAKDDRISVLEEALKESVTIAAEREELLAHQVHGTDTAAQRVEDIEMELDRTHLEMAITNTKNASLLLALNENDAILNYYKSERRHMLEEVFEMRQNALLATISEKDANIALLELTPTKNSDHEVVMLKREKDKLVNELKDKTQKRMTLITNEDNKEVHLSMELLQAPKDKVLDAIALIEDSMEKLQLYADDLLEVAKSHFPDLNRKLPKITPRDYGKYESKLNKASQTERHSLLQALEKDMQDLQDYAHKLLELVEDFAESRP